MRKYCEEHLNEKHIWTSFHHPDKSVKGSNADDWDMKKINCAKTILLDPEKRTVLDRYLGLK